MYRKYRLSLNQDAVGSYLSNFEGIVLEDSHVKLSEDGCTLSYNANGFERDDSMFNQWSSVISTETYTLNTPIVRQLSNGYFIEILSDNLDVTYIEHYLRKELTKTISRDLARMTAYYAKMLVSL